MGMGACVSLEFGPVPADVRGSAQLGLCDAVCKLNKSHP